MSASPTTPAYRVLARKYRPRTFADLIGQESLVRTLTNAFATGRIAQAYMLTGVRGVGKTTTARLIARALNYPAGATIDMAEITPQCEAILESRHMDVIEMDAASNTGVDNMREIIDSVRYAPVQARIKVYIIDEVHMLSKSAFNALLKTLEEPPPHVKFIFATTEIRKVPVTILSRCQRFDLKRMEVATLMQLYGKVAKAEEVEIEEEALRMIARAAEGSARDGLSLLDQAIAFGEGKVKAEDVMTMLGLMDRAQALDLFEAVMQGDAPRALAETDKQFQVGADPVTVLADLADFTHYVTRLKLVRDQALTDPSRTETEKARAKEYAEKLAMPQLSRCWQMLLKGISEVQQAGQPEQAAEMVLIRLCHAANLPQGEELVKLVQQAQSTAPRPDNTAKVEQLRRNIQSTDDSVASGNLAVQSKPLEAKAETSAPRAFSSFADIVKLATDKRDLKFKTDLERYVRPVSVADGRIEIALEPEASPTLFNEIKRKLDSWTGKSWLVIVAKSGGTAPIHAQKLSAKDTAREKALQDPTVQAILAAFPRAEMKVNLPQDFAVKNETSETEIVETTEASDEESD
jgi:DNA polymerase III subunit gamma/tau